MIPKRLFASGVVLLFAACATSPTGRKQLMMMPDTQMDAMGVSSFDEIKKQTPVETDAALNAYIKCVATPITKAAEANLGAMAWEIVVFKEPKTVNAFALPGGKIGVYTGILPVTKTDAQLAAVLGHEVGHVIAKHGNERVSQSLIVEGGLTIAQVLTQKSQYQGILLGLAGVGAQVGLLSYSRTQESEADWIGLNLMSRAGFDPTQSVELWKNMKTAAGGSEPPEFLSTHPSNSSRISGLQSHFDEALPLFHQARAKGLNPICQRPAI